MAKRFDKNLDVICVMYGDETIVPIRIRIEDDEGVRQAYNIKECQDVSHRGTFTRADGIYITNEMLVFKCKIEVFGVTKPITLYYDASKSKWVMSA